MKKALIVVLVLILSLGIATYALADDTSNAANPFKTAAAKIRNLPKLVLTDEQKAQKTQLMNQMLELEKQIIQSNVANGTITEDQAKVLQEKVDKRIAAAKSGDFKLEKPGHGRRGGFHRPPQQHLQNQTTNQ